MEAFCPKQKPGGGSISGKLFILSSAWCVTGGRAQLSWRHEDTMPDGKNQVSAMFCVELLSLWGCQVSGKSCLQELWETTGRFTCLQLIPEIDNSKYAFGPSLPLLLNSENCSLFIGCI